MSSHDRTRSESNFQDHSRSADAKEDHGARARPGQRRTLSYAHGVSDQVISPSLASKLIMLETVLEPGADFGERNIIDSSEQGGYVLEGELTLWIDDEKVHIEAGDGFQIPSGVPCRCANRSRSITKVLWVYG